MGFLKQDFMREGGCPGSASGTEAERFCRPCPFWAAAGVLGCILYHYQLCQFQPVGVVLVGRHAGASSRWTVRQAGAASACRGPRGGSPANIRSSRRGKGGGWCSAQTGPGCMQPLMPSPRALRPQPTCRWLCALAFAEISHLRPASMAEQQADGTQEPPAAPGQAGQEEQSGERMKSEHEHANGLQHGPGEQQTQQEQNGQEKDADMLSPTAAATGGSGQAGGADGQQHDGTGSGSEDDMTEDEKPTKAKSARARWAFCGRAGGMHMWEAWVLRPMLLGCIYECRRLWHNPCWWWPSTAGLPWAPPLSSCFPSSHAHPNS